MTKSVKPQIQESMEGLERLTEPSRIIIFRVSWEDDKGKKLWQVPCDLAFPYATQNDITQEGAEALTKNQCIGVAGGANMASTIEAINHFQKAKMLFNPSKAANAGDVAVSGLEMSQNSMHLSGSVDEPNDKLRDVMRTIHDKWLEYGVEKNTVDYVKGANTAGFIKLAYAMKAFSSV